MKVRHTATALEEIDEICAYIAKDSVDTAADIADAIERAIALIAERPNFGPVVHGDVRARLVPRYGFRIFYVIAGSEIIIRNVRRARRSRPWEDKR
jgi:plasmid stabilization system protein ParE